MADDPVGMILDTPLAHLLERLGLAIASAQFALDKNAVAVARLLADPEGGITLAGEDQPRSLLALGFTPAFYHVTEATIEAKVAFSVGRSSSFSVGGSAGVNVGFFAASVNASYSQKYSFDANASSSISAKFVSVPPPAVFGELLRASAAKNNDLSNSGRRRMAIGQELLNVPMGDMIRQMAFAIADAQFALDESSMRVAEMMSGQYPLRDEDGNLVDGDGNLLVGDDGKLAGDPVYLDSRVYFGAPVKGDDGKFTAPRLSMMELGFTPTFYQFIDTVIEVKIAIRITREFEASKKTQTKTANTKISTRLRSGLVKTKMNVSTTTVDAAYSAKYSYSAEGSSLLRTKLVPVPPPTVLEDRIRRLFDEQQAAAEPPPPPKE